MGSAKIPVLLAALGAAAVGGTAQPAAREGTAGCAGTTVHYGATRVGTPFIVAGGAFTGNLFYYSTVLGDGRVNRSDGVVTYAGVRGKVLWVPRKRRKAGGVLTISGRRLDGVGTFTRRVPAVPRDQFPSELEVPSAGCWRLTLRSGVLRASVVIEAVDPPAGAVCDPSPVYRDTPHPRFGAVTWMPATPRSGGVTAVSFVTTFPDAHEAVIPPGGHFPGGPNTKFLWWAPHPGGGLELVGRRLDALGRFREVFGSATGDVGSRGGQTIFPSIVDVPAAGCWSVTLRTGRSAGNVVFRVVPAD